MTLQIKFSHEYTKFPEDVTRHSVKLIDIFVTEERKLSPEFRLYDTQYQEYESYDTIGMPLGIMRHKYYPLPKGKVMVLLLLTDANELFTTIRQYIPEKYRYYYVNVGETFNIIVEDSK